jgi:DNA polymerase IIIc chi subunit
MDLSARSFLPHGSARARWTAYKGAGHALAYWQQNERGGWERNG